VTFTDLRMDRAGTNNQLIASVAGFVDAASDLFAVSAGPATQVQFVQQPTDATAGHLLSPAVTLLVTDAFGNGASAVSVSLALGSGSGPLNGTTTRVTDASGIASFNDLSLGTNG
jgi:hypothetical protein